MIFFPLRGFEWAEIGRRLVPGDRTTQGSIGILGFCSPNSHYIKDFLALGDPLLARLPSPYKIDWRPGHYDRVVPEGSFQWDTTGNFSAFSDPEIRDLAQKIKSAHRDPLFAPGRMTDIISLLFWEPSEKLLIESTYPNFVELNETPTHLSMGQYGRVSGSAVIEVEGRFLLEELKGGKRLSRRFLGGSKVEGGPWNLFFVNQRRGSSFLIPRDGGGCTVKEVTPSSGPPAVLRIPPMAGEEVTQVDWVAVKNNTSVQIPRRVVVPDEVNDGVYTIKFYPDAGQNIDIDAGKGFSRYKSGDTISLANRNLVLKSDTRAPLEWVVLIPSL